MSYELWFCRLVTKVNSLSFPARRRQGGRGSHLGPALPPSLPFSPGLNLNKRKRERKKKKKISPKLQPWHLQECQRMGALRTYIQTQFISRVWRWEGFRWQEAQKDTDPRSQSVPTSGQRASWDGHLNPKPLKSFSNSCGSLSVGFSFPITAAQTEGEHSSFSSTSQDCLKIPMMKIQCKAGIKHLQSQEAQNMGKE